MVERKSKAQEEQLPDKPVPAKVKPEPTIEELAQALKVPAWALAGMKRAYGFGAGKQMSESEFKNKLDKWLKGPMAR